MRVLVTGGTGSFGEAFTRTILGADTEHKAQVVVYSRDELKQAEMRTALAESASRLRFFIGDVRDGQRLKRAMEGCDVVVHAAAMKRIDACEYNPWEAIQTNVMGAQNVVNACLDTPTVKRVVALSTDKAASPVNLYGATKLCSDKLFIAANTCKGKRDLRFSVVRYGNVFGSRGSVLHTFKAQRERGVIDITDSRMTRFSLTLGEAVALVLRALERGKGGEVYVPRIPSYRILDLAAAIAPDADRRLTGIRPGEKLHETLITHEDAAHTADMGTHYEVRPPWDKRACGMPDGFAYTSDTNSQWLNVPDLRALADAA